MNIFSLSGFFIALTSAVLIVILLKYGKSKLHKIWSFFNITVFIWGIGCYLAGKAATIETAKVAWTIACIGGYFIAAVCYHTICVFCDLQRKKVLFLFYFLALLFSFFTIFYSQLVLTNWEMMFDSIYYNKMTPLYGIIFLEWVIVVSLAFYELAMFLKRSTDIKKSQSYYLLISLMVGFVGGGMTLFPALGIRIYPFTNFGVAVYAMIGTYAILKYRLMDLRVAITRFGVFVFVYTLVLGLPFAMVFAYKKSLQSFWGDFWWILPMVIMALFATAGPYIYLFLQKKAEDRLLATQKQYQQTLIQASLGMNRIKELQRLLNLIVHIVTKTVRIEHAGIYLLDPERNQYILKASRLEKDFLIRDKIDIEESLIKHIEKIEAPLIFAEIKQKAEDTSREDLRRISFLMEQMRSEMIVPNIVNKKMVGFISMGKKKSGKMYTEEDIAVFSILANQSALAIENAIFYEESGKDLAQRFHESRLRGLGQLSSGVAHQIHNRLNIISLGGAVLIDMLKDITSQTPREEVDQLIEKTKKDIEKMVNSAIRGEEIANAIKNYARANPKPQVIVFDEILQSSLSLVMTKHPDFKYELVKEYSSTSPIWANYSTMQDVIFNNIDNCCDAMKLKKKHISEGRLVVDNYIPRIRIATSDVDSNFKIEIEDNGIGMTTDQLEKMFVPFYTTKGAQKGTGMGMNVAYQLLSANKGTIAIDSVYQSWTKVTIIIPKATPQQIEADKNKGEDNGNAENPISG
ncbi:MAG TPA: ATP-binding protein [Candidatus Omnitrophota bacterium]|nr:ATP-binding protein [Candidatus Omnitrophota bacterium]HPN88906.1 ATP-binding protein [Candidatus Omnitrophota bacterium]